MRLTKLYMIPAVLAACMAATGCSMINDPETPCPEKEEEVSFRFKVNSAVNSTGHELTRSDDLNHGEDDSEIPLVEDMINVNDFAFYIFVSKTADDADAPLVFACTDIASSDDPNLHIKGSLGAYDVWVTIRKEALEGYLGHELSPNSTTPLFFRLAVIANSKASKAAAEGNFSSLPTDLLGVAATPTTFNGFVQEAENLNYRIDTGFYDSNGLNLQTKVKGLIPMFGLTSFMVPEDIIYKSRPEDRIYIGDVNLLRAVSKVRILDAIPRREGENYPRISSARFTYASPSGNVLPPDAGSYVNGTQVHSPSIPEQTAENVAVTFLSNPAGFKNDDDLVIPEWFIYSPEQKIETGTVPAVEISVKPSAVEPEITYLVPMSGYKGIDFPWTGSASGNEKYLLRNHIYTLNVTSVDITSLTLTFTAQPWTQSRLTLDYEANPSVSSTISWRSGTYTTGANVSEIFTHPWDSEENRIAAECSFTIDTPVDRPWTAFLIPTQGATGALKFVDADGNLVDTYSGTVGVKGTLKIVSTNPAPTVKNSALLQVIVDMGYGYMEAPVAGNYGNYTISQAAL